MIKGKYSIPKIILIPEIPPNLSDGVKRRRIPVQTKNDIGQVHGRELREETLSAEAAAQAGKGEEGSEFILTLPVN